MALFRQQIRLYNTHMTQQASLTIQDRIYGGVTVTDPLIIDLINSKPLQRLKAISQDGASHYLMPILEANRFEHSFGAWYLAQYYRRPIEEQVACLLHDVPHTAFSHVVDFVMNDTNQEYHDHFLEKIVMASEIPAICKAHGLDIKKVLNKENYYLLDNRTPELSFDRWDYFMRDGYMFGLLPIESIRLILESAKLADINGQKQFYFDSLWVASHLCITSMMVNELDYCSANAHGSWSLLASALKIALEQQIIVEEDLFTNDAVVMSKMQKANNSDINAALDRLLSGKTFEYTTEEEAEFYGTNKARYIDPLVKTTDGFKPVSCLIPNLPERIDIFKKQSKLIGVKQVM